MGLDNFHVSLIVLKLQSHVFTMANAKTPAFDNKEVWGGLAEGIYHLNSSEYFPKHIAE